jgi:hypothetical protein
MLVGGRPFNGSTSLLNAYKRLTPLAGYTSWFTEFRPIPSLEFDFIERLLLIFFKHNICCHISGSYVTYLAGVTNSFRGLSMYIALRDAPYNLTFQRGGNLDTSVGRISLCASLCFRNSIFTLPCFERRRLQRSPILFCNRRLSNLRAPLQCRFRSFRVGQFRDIRF